MLFARRKSAEPKPARKKHWYQVYQSPWPTSTTTHMWIQNRRSCKSTSPNPPGKGLNLSKWRSVPVDWMELNPTLGGSSVGTESFRNFLCKIALLCAYTLVTTILKTHTKSVHLSHRRTLCSSVWCTKATFSCKKRAVFFLRTDSASFVIGRSATVEENVYLC